MLYFISIFVGTASALGTLADTPNNILYIIEVISIFDFYLNY
jgi:hypothetical protein